MFHIKATRMGFELLWYLQFFQLLQGLLQNERCEDNHALWWLKNYTQMIYILTHAEQKSKILLNYTKKVYEGPLNCHWAVRFNPMLEKRWKRVNFSSTNIFYERVNF